MLLFSVIIISLLLLAAIIWWFIWTEITKRRQEIAELDQIFDESAPTYDECYELDPEDVIFDAEKVVKPITSNKISNMI